MPFQKGNLPLDWPNAYWADVLPHVHRTRYRPEVRSPVSNVNAPTWTRRNVKTATLLLSLMVSAGALAVALGSRDYLYVGWMALLPLFIAIRVVSPGEAFACGALWGSSFFLFSVAAGDTPVPATIQSFALLSTIPAIYAWLGALTTRRFGFSALFLGFGWIGVELALRPLDLSGGLLAGTQEDATFLSSLQSVLGYGFLAFVMAFVNGLLASALTRVRFGVSRSVVAISSGDSNRWLGDLPESIWRSFDIHSSAPRAPPLLLA